MTRQCRKKLIKVTSGSGWQYKIDDSMIVLTVHFQTDRRPFTQKLTEREGKDVLCGFTNLTRVLFF